MKKIPQFQNEDEEREFWATHDSTEYLNWPQGRRVVFPNLKPSLKTVSIRIPAGMLADLKTLAHQRDVPYQSLMKIFLSDRIRQERRSTSPLPAKERSRK